MTLRESQGLPEAPPPMRAAKWSQEKHLGPGSSHGGCVGRVRDTISNTSLFSEFPMVFPESFPLHIWRMGKDSSPASSCHKPSVTQTPQAPQPGAVHCGWLKGSHMC